MILLFFYPAFMDFLTPFLTTQDSIMSITVISIIGAFFLIAQLYQKMSELDRKMTMLVQHVAINDYIKVDGDYIERKE